MGSDSRPYKSRKIRPCDRCRKRKSRCIIEHHGPCQLCARMNVSCEFTDKVPPINRHKVKQILRATETVYFVDSEGPVAGHKTGDKMDDIDSSGEFSSNTPELSSYTSFSTSLSDITPTRNSDKEANEVSVESTEDKDDRGILGKISNTVPMPGLNTTMTLLTEDETKNDKCESQFVYLYHSGYLDPFLLHKSAALPSSESQKLHVKTLETSCQPQMQITIEDGSRSESNDNGLKIETFYPHTSNLCELYLKHINTHFPVVSATEFQKRINQNRSCFLLLTALILATDSWQRDPKLTLMERPNVDPVVQQVTQSILTEASKPSLAAIQSSLLLSQKLYLKGFGIDGTLELAILSVAYTFAQSMGINLDCTQWNISVWEKRIRRRLWWTLYIQEKWFSFSLGRRSHISRTDWNVCPLTESDFENETLSENNEQRRYSNKLFCLMAELTKLIDGYASEADQNTSLESAYKKADVHLQLISEFETKHFDYFRLENSVYPDSPVAALVIASVTAKATIYKSVLHRILLWEQEKPETTNDVGKRQSISKEAKQRSILLSAEILDILGRLRAYHFDSFWYSWARFNFATISSFFLLLNQMASKQQEEETIKSHITKLQFFIQSRLPIFSHLTLASQVLDLSGR
ncbi:hypothetical protein KL938_002618 [Ogataea parapolymorpha]|nr:hypothetical protein KL938_002618 [Ogataea parapolymorpha]